MSPPPGDAIELSSTTWQSIAEEASDGLFLTDAAFVIVWVNARACELLRRPLAELVGCRIPDLLWDPSDLTEEPLRRRELLAGGATITLRTFRTGDGERRVLEVSARGIGDGLFVGLARDATQRLETLHRLERSEASFRALAEQSPDSILVHAGGRVLYVNRAGAVMLGFETSAEAVGARLMDLVHPGDREAVQHRLELLETGDGPLPFSEERILRRDGAVFVASVGAAKVLFEGTPAVAVIGRDVTAQHALDAQYAQTQKMASIGLLAAGIAHEVNNPLAYTMLRVQAMAALSKRLAANLAVVRAANDARSDMGWLEATRACDEQAALLAELDDHIVTAVEGTEQVRSIVHDLRVFSRLDRDERSVIEVVEPLQRALSIAGYALERRAQVVRSFSPAPPVLASAGKLTQVFLNLLLNASQAIPEGRAQEHEVRVSVKVVDRAVHIAVSDTGCGVAPGDLPRLFEPFFTTRANGVSTGLGLAICHGIVTSLGGAISVDSTLGIGSTFTVSLPLAPGGD